MHNAILRVIPAGCRKEKKMRCLDEYLEKLIAECRTVFGKRLLYVGLQGSYMRGEANENSDIDVMVILSSFSVQDMDAYRGILMKIGDYEKSCGFICGEDEMKRWNPMEICHLRHATKDLVGSLDDFLPAYTREDAIGYAKLSLGNLFHLICHRYTHADRETNVSLFQRTCKGLFFLIQDLHFLETGRFIVSKRELMEAVSNEDREVLGLQGQRESFDADLAILFAWMQHAFVRLDAISLEGKAEQGEKMEC